MTPRHAILGFVAAALVFVTTLTRTPDAATQWPPIAAATASAAAAFVWIWFFVPLMAWPVSAVVSRLRRALRPSTQSHE